MNHPLPSAWNDPPWLEPLDVDACLAAVPADATITGMFLAAVRDVARARNAPISSARERYTAFHPYPLREHCQLLVDVARAVFPRSRLRDSLRRMGRGAPGALGNSLVGRVMLGSAEGPIPTLRAMCKSYTVHMKPCELEVVELGERSAVVRMAQIHNFLDSHNVGVFEGVLHHAGVKGRVRIASHSPSEADLLCEW